MKGLISLMVSSYCGFHLIQFWMQFFIQKGLESSVFHLENKGKSEISESPELHEL